MKGLFLRKIGLACVFFLLSACRSYWKENPNIYLLTQVNVKMPVDKKTQQALKTSVYPQTNKKIFGLRFYLGLYELGDKPNLPREIELNQAKYQEKEKLRQEKYRQNKKKRLDKLALDNQKRIAKGKEPKDTIYPRYRPKEYRATFKQWLVEKAGEAPVFLDTAQIEKGMRMLSAYLFNKGFFDHELSFQVDKSQKRHKAKLTYLVDAKPAYQVRTWDYVFQDTSLLQYVKTKQKKWDLPTLVPFDLAILEKRRNLITENLRDAGFYKFKRDFIVFELDTSVGKRMVDVTFVVQNPVKRSAEDSTKSKHTRYTFDKINFYINADPNDLHYIGTKKYKNYQFIYERDEFGKPKTMPYRKGVLSSQLLIEPNQYFNEDALLLTQSKLTRLDIFRYTDFVFHEKDSNKLDAWIITKSRKKNSWMADLSGTVRGANLGARATLGVVYRNVFKGAEFLKIQVSGGFEAQPLITESDAQSSSSFRYVPNTYQITPQLTFTMPRFWLFLPSDFFPKRMNAQTNVSFVYDFQKRPDYSRHTERLALYYDWSHSTEHTFFQHTLTPIELSFVKFLDKSQPFKDKIDALGDIYLKSAFQDYFIPATVYTMNFRYGDAQKLGSQINNFFSLEFSGSTLRGLAPAFKLKKDEFGGYQVFDITFTQYVKIQNDFKYYYNINGKSSFAVRAFAGIANPLRNLKSIPFDKQFFSGGTSDNRAWNNYTIGPGSHFDTLRLYDKVGEVKLALSAEYRYHIISFLEGAVFADAGNIWLLQKNSNYSNGEFASNRFYKEIAFTAGLGFRLNFNNLFIVRLDIGFPMHDPSLNEHERWIWQPKTQYNDAMKTYNEVHNRQGSDKLVPYSYVPKFNIAIGYPF